MFKGVSRNLITREDAETLKDLLIGSGRVNSHKDRESVCLEISIASSTLDFVYNTAPDSFSVLLVVGEIYNKQRGDPFRSLCIYLTSYLSSCDSQRLFLLSKKRFDNEQILRGEIDSSKAVTEDWQAPKKREAYDSIENELRDQHKHYWRYFEMKSKELADVNSFRQDYFLELIRKVRAIQQRFENLKLANERVLQSSIQLLFDDVSIVISTSKDVCDLLRVNSNAEKNCLFASGIERFIQEATKIKKAVSTARSEAINTSCISVSTQRTLKDLLGTIASFFDDTLDIYKNLGGISIDEI